ncbi:MAG: undecaprenyl-diphosphate phosphatase [Acidimicrobiales bacterium]
MDAVPAALPILHAIVLGIVQGLTEFLPVSSSGHLIIVPWLFGWTELTRNPELNRSFDVALHMGTFVGAVAYFRNDLWRLATSDRRLGLLIGLSTVPAVLAGVALQSVVDDQLSAEWLIGVMLVVFGLVLAWADRLPGRQDISSFGPREALWMGAAQAAALQPGVSRSGATMSMGRYLGFDRDASARISFLMSLPIIAGAGVFQGAKVMADGGLPAGVGPAFAWGVVTSGVTGFIAVWALLRLIRTRSFTPFVAYRVVAGLAVIAVALIK